MSAAEQTHFRHPPFRVAKDGFAFTLPPAWEVLGFLLEEKTGRFSFSSEAGACGQFSWRPVKAIPDLPRIIEEIHRRELGADAPPKMRFTRHGKDGAVVLAHTRGGERFYASAFNREKMLLNEWIFPKYTPENAETVVPMLETYSNNLPDADGRVYYALFGLELTILKDFVLNKIEPFPAAVSLSFENPRHHTFIAHRWGMADIFMQGSDTANFLHRYLYAKRFAIKGAKAGEALFGRETGEVEYRARGKFGFDFLLGPWWRGYAAAFLDRQENRIYGFEHLASRNVPERETLKAVFAPKLTEKKLK